MKDLDVPQKRLSFGHSNRALIPVLVPMFLILSSSVYPLIMSSMEKEETKIIPNVMAELPGKDNTDSSRYQAHMQVLRSHIPIPSSATPIAPTIASEGPIIMQMQSQEEDNIMEMTSIDSGKAVHSVWSEGPGNPEVFYKRDGADFDPTTVNLSNNAGGSQRPAIAVSGNNVHVAWSDSTSGNFDILYRRSFDGGATFGPTINLSNNAEGSFRPALAVSGNTVHVVWVDETPGNSDIFYRRSTDGGVSFTDPIKNLSSNPGESLTPAIAVSGNKVHVVWSDTTSFDIFYRRSLNGGTTFPNIVKNLSGSGETLDEGLAIAATGDSVHVVWQDFEPTTFNILYRRSIDGGTTFPNVIKKLSDSVGPLGAAFPAISASGNNVHVVWSEGGNGDIFYRRSIDGGATFAAQIKNLSSNAAVSFAPAIALSGDNVYVVWEDLTDPNAEILYRTSSDSGATFPPLMTNLSVSPANSVNPSIAAS